MAGAKKADRLFLIDKSLSFIYELITYFPGACRLPVQSSFYCGCKTMNWYAVIPLGGFLMNFFLWSYMFAMRKHNRPRIAYIYFVSACMSWAFIDFFAWSVHSVTVATVLLRIQIPCWLSAGFLFCNFLYELVGKRRDTVYWFFAFGAAGFSLIGVFSSYILKTAALVSWGALFTIGELYYPALAWCVLAASVYSIMLLLIHIRKSTGLLRKQLAFTLAGIVIFFTAAIIINVGVVIFGRNFAVPSLGSSLTCIQSLFVFAAMSRYQFLMISIPQAASDLFARSGDGIVLFDPHGIVVEMNRAARSFFGIGKNPVQGLEVKSFIPEPYDPYAEFSDIEVSFPGEYSRRVARLSQHRIFQGDEFIGFLLMARDITEKIIADEEKKALEDNVRKSHEQKMIAIGQLAGGIAHDFNNSLTGIIGSVELLSRDGISEENKKRYLGMIMNASFSVGELIRKLLTFAGRVERASEAISVAKVIEDTIEILRRTIDRKIAVQYENSFRDAVVTGDYAMLQNVFLNMGINASHAMPDGGILSFRISRVLLDSNFCGAGSFKINPGSYVDIAIQDNGCGMTSEIQKHIFEPFFTTKEPGKGTGLGLSAAYGTLQDHHGAIDVSSEPGAGTVFHIYLPLSDEKAAVPVRSETVTGTGTVLLIDDDDTVRSTTGSMLESLGYTVLDAPDGQKGISIFGQHRDAIGLVLLDMIMPVMSGRETFMRLRELYGDVKVIVFTGYSKEADLSDMKRNGLRGFIKKPFRLEEFSRVVSDVMTGN